MITSALRRRKWAIPLGRCYKQGLLLAILTLFASAQLLSSAPPKEYFDGPSITSSSSGTDSGSELTATAESNESSVSMIVALRDATVRTDDAHKARFRFSSETCDLRSHWRPGANGPPSHNNNLTA